MSASSAPTAMPLADYVVLDLSIARAGPVAVRLLSDWGARVIRVEPPPRHDRGSVTGKRRSSDEQNMHRNKRSLCLDLKSPRGREILRRLVLKSDVVVENFRADVKERLGVSYDQLRDIKPDIILASISGFGQTGPYSDRPCVDQVMQGMCGLMSVTGEPDGKPIRAGIAISDTTAGMFLGQGILLALLHRQRTGQGQWVHTSLLESMLNKLDFQAARYTVDGKVPTREGNYHPTLVPMGTYEASDGYVNISASTERMWKNLCEVLDAPSLLMQEAYKGRSARYQNRRQLNEELNALTRTFKSEELIDALNARGVPSGPVLDIGQALYNEQTRHIGMTRRVEHPVLGELDLIRSPINMSGFPHPPQFAVHAPDPGENSEEILCDLGYNPGEIESFMREEVCC
jgi:crotonobetainyl-CoA:carnitine CoA-transferase CaiB-like acyl-CoA transferase